MDLAGRTLMSKSVISGEEWIDMLLTLNKTLALQNFWMIHSGIYCGIIFTWASFEHSRLCCPSWTRSHCSICSDICKGSFLEGLWGSDTKSSPLPFSKKSLSLAFLCFHINHSIFLEALFQNSVLCFFMQLQCKGQRLGVSFLAFCQPQIKDTFNDRRRWQNQNCIKNILLHEAFNLCLNSWLHHGIEAKTTQNCPNEDWNYIGIIKYSDMKL